MSDEKRGPGRPRKNPETTTRTAETTATGDVYVEYTTYSRTGRMVKRRRKVAAK